jgi:hypothetical protein
MAWPLTEKTEPILFLIIKTISFGINLSKEIHVFYNDNLIIWMVKEYRVKRKRRGKKLHHTLLKREISEFEFTSIHVRMKGHARKGQRIVRGSK